MQIESTVGGANQGMLVWRTGHEFMHEHEREHNNNAFQNFVAF